MNAGSEILLYRLRQATTGEYEIERQVGMGGMAAVFLARDIALTRQVAIKVMRPDLVDIAGLEDRFLVEARTAANLDHPGIVSVYAVRHRAGLIFIVMKYIEGETLETTLGAKGRLDPAYAASVGSRVAEALHYAHGEGIIHRDVKPSNIMIDTRGRVVVTDFGIARVTTAQSMTVAGSMLGTAEYMSPEQCRGLPASAASDQYSLGVTLYEMLTGRMPFSGSFFELLEAHRDRIPQSVHSIVPEVDPGLDNIVMRMLAKDPGQRWSSLGEVAEQLASNSGGHRTEVSPTPPSGASAVPELISPSVSATDVSSPGRTPSPVPAPQPGPFAGSPSWDSPAQDLSMAPTADGDLKTSRRSGRRTATVSAIALGIVGIAVAAILVNQGPSNTRAPVTQFDTEMKVLESTAPSESLPSVRGVSDSASAALPAPAPVVTVDTVTKSGTRNAAGAPDALKAPAPPSTPQRRDSPRQTRQPPESLSVQCARLLERQSLGERLTDDERTFLRRCPSR